MDLPVEESVWAVIFASALILAGVVRGIIWLVWKVRRKEEVEVLGVGLNLPPEYRPEWLDVLILFLMGLGSFILAGSVSGWINSICGKEPMSNLIASLIPPLVCVSTGWVLLRWRGISPVRIWQWKWRSAGEYWLRGLDRYLVLFVPISVLAAASMIAFKLAGVEHLAQPLVKQFLDLKDVSSVVFLVIMAVVIAPLWEEIVFRGVLYPMLRGLQDRVFALLATGVLFGLVHGHGPAFMPLTFLGMALAWLYERSGKLGYCVGLHSSFNAITTIMLLLIKYAPK